MLRFQSVRRCTLFPFIFWFPRGFKLPHAAVGEEHSFHEISRCTPRGPPGQEKQPTLVVAKNTHTLHNTRSTHKAWPQSYFIHSKVNPFVDFQWEYWNWGRRLQHGDQLWCCPNWCCFADILVEELRCCHKESVVLAVPRYICDTENLQLFPYFSYLSVQSRHQLLFMQ